MKYLLFSIAFFCFINLFAQSDKKIYLNTLNDSLMESIIKQGKFLFKKSDCIKSNIDDYFIIPEFLAQSKIPLQELRFSSKDSLLSNLYVTRKSARKFLVNFSWNVIDKSNMTLAYSDWKRFYCYNVPIPEYLYDYFKSVNEHLGLNNVKYVFAISGTFRPLEFIVSKDEQVFIYYNKKWMTLSEFDVFYKSGKIKKFDDNPFK